MRANRLRIFLERGRAGDAHEIIPTRSRTGRGFRTRIRGKNTHAVAAMIGVPVEWRLAAMAGKPVSTRPIIQVTATLDLTGRPTRVTRAAGDRIHCLYPCDCSQGSNWAIGRRSDQLSKHDQALPHSNSLGRSGRFLLCCVRSWHQRENGQLHWAVSGGDVYKKDPTRYLAELSSGL